MGKSTAKGQPRCPGHLRDRGFWRPERRRRSGTPPWVLTEQMGGSGSFTYLAAMLNKNGVPKQAAMTQLGDRTQIKSLAVRDGQVIVDLLTHGPNDPMCCPSQLVTRTYAVAEQALKVVGQRGHIISLGDQHTRALPLRPSVKTPPKPVSAARSDKDLSFEIEGSSDKCVA